MEAPPRRLADLPTKNEIRAAVAAQMPDATPRQRRRRVRQWLTVNLAAVKRGCPCGKPTEVIVEDQRLELGVWGRCAEHADWPTTVPGAGCRL